MKKFIIFGALSLSFIGCNKDDSVNNTVITTQPENFQEIQVGPNFSWSTETEFRLNLVAIKNVPFSTTNFIEVRDLEGNLLFKTIATTADTRTIKFMANGDLATAVVSFGTISKELNFVNKRAEFNFIAFDDRSDIETEN